MFSFGQLLSPLNYLLIRHERKVRYDIVIPFFVSLALSASFLMLPARVGFLDQSGPVNSVIQLVPMLVGFFIAALAAIATFKDASLDLPMVGRPPVLTQRIKGKAVERILTRRMFLCYLFGYLSFISLFLFIFSSIVRMIAPSIGALFTPDTIFMFRVVGVFFFIFLVSNLIVTTMIGLFYLTERIHRHDTRVVPPPANGADTDVRKAV